MFKPGQKVVCIDDSPTRTLPQLKLNEIYIVRDMAGCCKAGVYLEGISTPPALGYCSVCFNIRVAEHSYKAERFRAIDDTFAEETLANIAEQIEEELLVAV